MKYDYEIQSYVGNFFLRITSDKIMSLVMSAKPRTSNHVFQDPSNNHSSDPNRDVVSALLNLGETVKFKLQNMEMGEALQEIVDVLKLANAVMTTVAPWSREPHIARASYATSIETLRICGICLQPFVPTVARKLLDALGIPLPERTWAFTTLKSEPSKLPESNVIITRRARFFERSNSQTLERRD